MRRHYRQILVISISLFCCQATLAQTDQVARGSLIIRGQVKSGTKQLALKKKRFYLFHGGLDANKSLVDKLKVADPISADCFYCRQKASPELLAWLKKEDCESIYCREITAEDIASVPEFQAAYNKGLSKMRKKPELALKWLVTYLDAGLRTGFYDARKALVKQFEKQIIQTAMTDNARDPRGKFANIPLNGSVEKFVYTNLVPIEIGEKSYVWVCEADVSNKDKTTPALDTDAAKLKNCEVIVRSLPVCKAGVCEQK